MLYPRNNWTQVLLTLQSAYRFEDEKQWNVWNLYPSSRNVIQNWPINLDAQSNIVELIKPKCIHKSAKNNFNASWTLMTFLQGINAPNLLNRSSTINKKSRPLLDIDQPRTKSIEIVSQGLLRIGNGMYNPSFLLFDLLIQRAQYLIILETCSYILGQ